MIDETLRKLIEFIQDASPVVWQTLIKQVYVEASARILWALALLVLGYLVIKLVNAKKKKYDEDYDDGQFLEDSAWAVGYIIAAVIFIIAFALFVSSLMRFMNPQFYAIRFILGTITR